MSDHANQADAAVDQGPLSPGAVKALKIAIVVMGIMIIIGVALVIGRVIYLVSKPASSSSGAVSQYSKPSFDLAVPAGAVVEHVALDGPRIAVTYKTGGQSSVIIYNLETGEKITEIHLKFDRPAVGSIPQGG